MVSETDPRPVLRQELTRVFKNQRVIRAFEKIFDLIPPEFINQQVQLDAVNLIGELASSQAVAAITAIEQLAAAVDRLALSPPRINESPQDDISPRNEPGDIKASTVEAKLTDTSTNLIASSVAMTNGAAVAAATLLNAPVAGNPTKWVTVDDAGTLRLLPLW